MSTLSSPATTKTHKSMLRNLFAWKKPSTAVESNIPIVPKSFVDPQPRNPDAIKQPPPPPPPPQQELVLVRKPTLSQRSRSDTVIPQRTRSRSKSRRRDRSRCRAVWDPPPLFQAYNQAYMFDTLQTPTKGFLDWLPRNSPAKTSAKFAEPTDDDKDDIASPAFSHRRSMSDSTSASLSKKLIFLSENGHILQYKVEGSHDRLPERVLELSRESVAFASDAIAGQHWVLEICPYGGADSEIKVSASKSSWSRMTLKTTDTKRSTEKLLLVFDSANARFEWLFAIRKQIEGLGGLEYQPDAPPLPQLESKRPNLRHTSSEYFKRKNVTVFSRSSSALPLRLDGSSEHEKELPQLPAGLSYQRSVSARSTTASSVATTTSLEGLRESYSGSSIAGTALSSDVSATSLSPTNDAFPPLLSPTLVRDFRNRATIDKSMPRTPTSPLYSSEESSKPVTTAMSPDDYVLVKKHDTHAEDTVSNEIDTKSSTAVAAFDAKDTTEGYKVTLLESAPIPELRRRLRQARRNLSVNDADLKPTSEAEHVTKPSHRHAAKPSLGTSKGTYGLFPRNTAIDTKADLSATSPPNHISRLDHSQSSDQHNDSAIPTTPVRSRLTTDTLSRSNTSLKRPLPIDLPHLLIPVDLEQPMRSPAVTSAMLDSNFGTIPCGTMTEPASPIEIQMPDFRNFRMDRSLFDSVGKTGSSTTSPTSSPMSKCIVPRRSMPNFHYNCSSSVSAPVGPPPSGPLPAVPAAAEGRNSRTSTPSKRTSAQGATSRRASTKSASSIKKGRSPVPSFSVPLPRSPILLPSSIESYSQANIQKISTFLSLLSVPKADETTSTMGKVSVLAAPPAEFSSTSHKKTQSVSSTQAGQPPKTYATTPLNQSSHDPSLLSRRPLTSRIPPPCAFETSFGYRTKGCFGMSSSR